MADDRIEADCWFNDRTGAHCWYKARQSDNDWRGGRLLAWSTDHIEYDSGPGMFPVGVVEDEQSGLCHSIAVTQICFAAVPPAESP